MRVSLRYEVFLCNFVIILWVFFQSIVLIICVYKLQYDEGRVVVNVLVDDNAYD